MVSFDITYLMTYLIATVAFAILAPIIGCLLAGFDRVISAKLQGRVGPPVLQPYYDVMKLFGKENASINTSERVYIALALLFAILAGGFLFSGENLLMCVFVITLSTLLVILAAYSSRSPYSETGAAREILQVMAYEPMVLIFCATIALYCMSFGLNINDAMEVKSLLTLDKPAICSCWVVFIGLIYVLTIKLRKSPFDLSSSHHAHQELVSGMTTEMSGRTLALLEITHWVESVVFLGWVGIFFLSADPKSVIFAILASFGAWLLEIIIDNNAARVKWQFMLFSAWGVAFVTAIINLMMLA